MTPVLALLVVVVVGFVCAAYGLIAGALGYRQTRRLERLLDDL